MTISLMSRSIRTLSVYLVLLLLCIVFFQKKVDAATPKIGLSALLEIDPKDTVSIDFENHIQLCTAHLSDSASLSQSQICKLHLLRGRAYLGLQKYDDAMRDLEEVAKHRSKDDFEIQLLRSWILGRKAAFGNRGLMWQAMNSAKELIRIKPNSAEAHNYMAMLLLATGNRSECITNCNKSISLDKSRPEAYFVRGAVHEQNGDFQEALDDLDNCIKLGGYAVGTKGAAAPFIVRAMLLMGPFDNVDQAFRDLTTAHQIDPCAHRLKYGMWYWYFKQGKYQLADYLSQMLVKDNFKPQADDVRFFTLLQKGLLDDALKMAQERASKSPPGVSHGYYSRGLAHFAKGEYDDAKFDFNLSSTINDKNIIYIGAHAYLMSSVPKFRNGNAALKIALRCCEKTQYKNPHFIMLLAMSHAAAGHKHEAIKIGEEALGKLHPSSHLREHYEKRVNLFREGKTYDFSPKSKVLDYLFF